MRKNSSFLGHNIRFLRKEENLSQEKLAEKLGIKRSNIAAYESKNVEPRLKVILEIAKLFDVNLKDLITKQIDKNTEYQPYKFKPNIKSPKLESIEIEDEEKINTFIQKSMKVKKVLEGFKSFYAFKKEKLKNSGPESEKLIFDIENFIQLMEHLMEYNESIIDIFTRKDSESRKTA